MICRLRFLKLCLSVAGMMVLASCGNVVLDEEEEGAVVTDGKCMLNVTCAFSQSIGDFPSTRLSLPSVVSRISFAVIQSGKVVWHDEQMCDNDEDDSFGKVTAPLRRGACTLVIFAHNGDAALPFDDEGHVAPANHRVTDSFSYAADLMIDDSVTDVDVQVVAFKLRNEEYGFSILNVQEIKGLTDITRVPFAPDFIKGVINLRGSVLPVIDLKKRLGLEDTPYTANTRIVIVQYDEVSVGMLVDAVTEVRTISAADIDTTRAITSGSDSSSKFISGIGKVDGRLIIQLNISEIIGLSGEE